MELEGYWDETNLPIENETSYNEISEFIDKLDKIEIALGKNGGSEIEINAHLKDSGLSYRTGYFGSSICRICDQTNGWYEYITHDLCNEKKFTWPEGLIHYYREHGVKPSDKFKSFIMNFDIKESTGITLMSDSMKKLIRYRMMMKNIQEINKGGIIIEFH